MQTLEEYLHAATADRVGLRTVAEVVKGLATAAIELSETIGQGALGGGLSKPVGRTNGGGDDQKQLDLLADELVLRAVSKLPLAAYASEELEDAVLLDSSAELVLAVDPLDGSSNIDSNASIGTIFSILPTIGDSATESSVRQSLLQPGSAQLASGFFIYGPQLSLALTLGAGTDLFIYSRRLNAFQLAVSSLQIPPRTQEFAINVANYRHWEEPVRHYIDDCLEGEEGPHGRNFNMRWPAALVADAYRIFKRGGIYLYPSDARRGYGKGRLRLVYEANPIAFLVENAGGSATDMVRPILSIQPTSLHERIPLAFGSRDEIAQVRRYHADLDPVGVRSPLFGNRGLFRT